jgi:autotransporter-associated beta strand protein
MPAPSFRCLLVIFVIAIVAAPLGAQTWTGADPGGPGWSRPGNWTPSVPVHNTGGQLTFGVPGPFNYNPNQDIINPFALNLLTLTGSFSNTIGGLGIDFRASGTTPPAIVYDGTGSPQITSNLYFTDTTEIRGAGTGTLRLSGLLPQTGGIIKSGGFDLLLDSHSGTTSGPTTINGGRVVLGSTGLLQNSIVTINADNGLAFANGLTSATLGGLAGSGALNIGAVDVTVGKFGGNSVFSGPLSATTGGISLGLGNLTLTGGGSINNLSAPTTGTALVIGGGTLTVTSTTTDAKAAVYVSAPGITSGSVMRVEGGGRLVLGPGATAILGGGTSNTTNYYGELDVTGVGSAIVAPTSRITLGAARFGVGQLTVTNGATAAWGTIAAVGTPNGGGGSVLVSAGGVLTSGANTFGNSGGSVIDPNSRWTMDTFQNGGGLTVSNGGAAIVTGQYTGSGGTLTVNGGTFITGSLLQGSANAPIRISDPAGGVALTVGSDNTSTTFSSSIADSTVGPGSLTKVGTGTLTLTGSLSYTGVTEVRGGTLAISGGTLTGGTYRANGGTLQLINEALALGSTGFFRADGPGTIGMQNVTVTGGYIYGPGLLDFSGAPSTVTGTTLFSGARTVLIQDVAFSRVTSGGSTQVNATRTLTWDGGTLTSAGSLSLDNGATANVRAFDSSGVITIAAGGTLNNSSNPLTLGGGSRTYIGSVASPGGTLNLGGQTLELNGGLLINNGTVVGTTNVNFGSLAMGSGTYGSVNVTTGGKFSPGNSPGSVTTGPATLGSGSVYRFDINDARGNPGVNWDLWRMSSLNITAGSSSNSAIQILLASESPSGGAGQVANFDPTQEYDWVIAQSFGGVVGFSPDLFRVDKTGFANPTGIGNFSVTLVGTELHLHFSPVPEPGAFVLVGAAAIGWIWRRRRTSVLL